MSILDCIIQNREQILELAEKHGVTSLKLYGSVLARKETAKSDIDFLAIFDSSIDYDWEARFKVQDELEAYFNNRVSIVDSRRIPNVFESIWNFYIEFNQSTYLLRNFNYHIFNQSHHSNQATKYAHRTFITYQNFTFFIKITISMQ